MINTFFGTPYTARREDDPLHARRASRHWCIPPALSRTYFAGSVTTPPT
jgi:hypothetical protein